MVPCDMSVNRSVSSPQPGYLQGAPIGLVDDVVVDILLGYMVRVWDV